MALRSSTAKSPCFVPAQVKCDIAAQTLPRTQTTAMEMEASTLRAAPALTEPGSRRRLPWRSEVQVRYGLRPWRPLHMTSLQTILRSEATQTFTAAGEELLETITVSGPITRGQAPGREQDQGKPAVPHVYSLHQDPCFFSSLEQYAAASGTGGGDIGMVYPFTEMAELADFSIPGACEGGGQSTRGPDIAVTGSVEAETARME